MVIPTRYKSKLPRTLSYPIGAQALSEALANTPHADALTIWFSDQAVWPASEFQRLVRERKPYSILVAEYRPALKPGYRGSNSSIERGVWQEEWKLRVNPVLRELRHQAHELLVEQGLPAIVDWLRSSNRAGWTSLHQRIELLFNPVDPSLLVQQRSEV